MIVQAITTFCDNITSMSAAVVERSLEGYDLSVLYGVVVGLRNKLDELKLMNETAEFTKGSVESDLS